MQTICIILHSSFFSPNVATMLKMYVFTASQMHGTILLIIVALLYIRYPELLYFACLKFCTPAIDNYHSTLCSYEFDIFKFHIQRIYNSLL